MWNRESKKMLALSFALSGFIGLQMLMYAADALFGWKVLHYNLFWLCVRWIHQYGIRVADTFMALFVFGVMVHAGWIIAGQFIRVRRTTKRLRALRSETLTAELNARFGWSERHETVLVVRGAAPIAMTIGFIRPSVVVSEGLLELLDDEETEAVLAHERFHQQHRDPLFILLVLTGAKVFWYIPLLAWCHKQFAVSREMLADHYAIARTSPYSLGSALLKLAKRNVKREGERIVVASFAKQSIAYRIEQLVNPSASLPKTYIPLKESLVSVIVYGMLFAAFVLSML